MALYAMLLAAVPTPAFARQAAPHSVLGAYDLREKDPVQYDLGRALREISGLAIDGQGRIFAHQDERGVVFELDPATGHTVRTFRVGRNGVRGDFEGIAAVGERLFLVSSDGTILDFAPGADGAAVEYARHETASRKLCREVEGLDYDAASGRLLLACKFTAGKERRDQIVVLGWSLRGQTLDSVPAFAIPLDALKRAGINKELSPSGIAIHPISRTIFIVAARENAIVELAPNGTVLAAVDLRGRIHHQPEGIAFAKDGTLYIADEGRSGRATLTVYPPDPARLH